MSPYDSLPPNTEAAAHAENAMRTAVAIAQAQYFPDAFGAGQWLYILLTELLGLPEHVAYPTIDAMDRATWPASAIRPPAGQGQPS